MSDPRTPGNKPTHQRPEHPDFWNKRFDEGVTPWDAGGVPAALLDFLGRHPLHGSVLLPGCGSAWEATELARRHWAVTAIDFSPVAVAAARAVLGDTPVTLQEADFFTFAPEAPFDMIYERAFLCALPRHQWADWGRRMAELLAPGGLLAGFFFFDDQPVGPPFGILHEQLHALLGGSFDRIEDTPVSDSLPVFAGRERWQVWRRR